MTDRHVTEHLNDYVDGLLTEATRHEVERHLAACAACRTEAEALRSLLADLNAAPKSIPPARDLWVGIAGRIGKRETSNEKRAVPRRVSRFPFPVSRQFWLAAAAVALIVVSSAVTVLLLKREGPGATNPRIVAVDTRYAAALDALVRALAAERDRLPPVTRATVERSLGVIDGALREARAALARDPMNPVLLELYASTYEHKLDLLRRAARVSAPI